MDVIRDDAAQFASLLARLKSRTDRSYSSLARHLDMNTSTLHRYCRAEVVPADFAVIERFANLCGASRQEREELYRRWILADAERRRQRTPGARRAVEPSTRASGPALTVAGKPDGPGDKPTERSSPAATGQERLPSAQRRPPYGRPRGRLTRVTAVAASLVIPLAALTASAAVRDSPHQRASAVPGRSTPSATTSPPRGAGHPPPAAAPTPSGTGPSAFARPSSKPSAPAADKSGENAREDPTDTGTVVAGAPLTWTADSHVWQLECDHDYVIARPPRLVPPPPVPADAAAWAGSQGAVHGRTTNLRITVQGQGPAAVVLTALHVRIAERTAPATRPSIAYSMYEGCGAALIPRYFSVDLDTHRPLARSVPGNDPGRPAPAIDFPYRVSQREPEVLFLSARTVACTCDWYLELDWSSQGRTGSVRVDDHGRPFRTTTIKGLPHYWYRHPAGWVPMKAAHEDPGAGG
ncbi:helix-turn-helix domain-containing protein [Streptomyces sp. NPDC058459]|uniref:helix-turn-helix domain-containing protein n=1 Tax=Streptomyces sp. NPDC058459 TaxID=3346508 RepID=UPI00365E6989